MGFNVVYQQFRAMYDSDCDDKERERELAPLRVFLRLQQGCNGLLISVDIKTRDCRPLTRFC